MVRPTSKFAQSYAIKNDGLVGSLYVGLYIYVCVCVCMSACAGTLPPLRHYINHVGFCE
jgi:hypothetical protein